MPELAEVEYYRKRWEPGLGQRITGVEIHPLERVFRGVDLEALHRGILGARMVASEAQAKQLVFRFEPGGWLGLHLGMTGALLMAEAGHQQARHEHLCLTTAGGPKLIFRDSRLFGRVRWHPGPKAPVWWTSIPPALLSDSFTEKLLTAILGRHTHASLKALLLRQEFFPGIGNWMADEVLWRAQLSPRTPAGSLSPAAVYRLHTVLREVCRDALAVIGEDWGTPPDTWLFNHRWSNKGLCPRDGHALRRETVGGRTTCYCPRCQPQC